MRKYVLFAEGCSRKGDPLGAFVVDANEVVGVQDRCALPGTRGDIVDIECTEYTYSTLMDFESVLVKLGIKLPVVSPRAQ
jgi:hypothetical protein